MIQFKDKQQYSGKHKQPDADSQITGARLLDDEPCLHDLFPCHKMEISSIHLKLFVLLILLYIFIMEFIYIAQEQNIYYWDFAAYWRCFVNLSNNFSLTEIISSIKNSDYNLTPVLLPSIIGKFFTTNRLAYVLILTVLYYIPFITFFIYCIFLYKTKNIKDILLITFFISFTPIFIATIFRGYPDICGMIFVILSVIICSREDFTVLNIKSAVLAGICLYICFLLRRWYAYTIVSLYISLPFLNFSLFYKRHRIKDGLKYILINFSLSLIVSFLLLISLQTNLFFRIINTDYSYIYLAYQKTFSASLSILFERVGLLVLPFFLLGLLKSFIEFRSKESKIVFFSLFNLVFSFYIFTRTQSPGIHHCLPFVMWICIISSFGIIYLFSLLKRRTIFIVIFFIIAFVSQQTSFFKYDIIKCHFYTKVCSIFPQKYYPLQVDNFEQYLELIKTIEKLTMHKDKVYIISSSEFFNEDMVRSLSQRLNIANHCHVDLRDGIPIDLLNSEYVVIAIPNQFHLPSDNQRVISIPNDNILNRKNIGNAYEKTEHEFILHNGIKAIIYHKKRHFEMDEINEFLNDFYKFYPDWKDKYDNKKLFKVALCSKISLGDGRYSTFLYDIDSDSIIAHPGDKIPVVVKWNIGNVDKIMFSANDKSCNNDDPVLIKILYDNGEREYIIEKGKNVTINAFPYKNKDSMIIIDKFNTPYCDTLYIRAID